MISNPTVSEIAAAIQDIATAISGMRYAPEYPPDRVDAFPFAATYASAGELVREQYSANTPEWIFTTELHVARKDMARDLKAVTPIAEAFMEALAAQLHLAVQAQIATITAAFGGSEWGGVETRAWVFTTRVRMNRST